MSLRFVAVAALTRTIGPPGLHTRLNEAPIFLPRFLSHRFSFHHTAYNFWLANKQVGFGNIGAFIGGSQVLPTH